METEPVNPTIRRDEAGRLALLKEGAWVPVKMVPCFPWRRPREYLSLRDKEKNEVALVRSLDALDAESRAAIEAALDEAEFALRVVAVDSVETDFELRVWHVKTHSGSRRFVTKLEDWPDQMDDGRIAIRDLSGDVYIVPSLDSLDKKSREILWAFVV